MSNAVALVGNDIININGRIMADLVDGDCAVLTVPNDSFMVTTGKNGNSLFAYNYKGLQGELVLRLVRGSADDKFLNNLLQLHNANPVGLTLINGSFTKNIGDGNGSISPDVYFATGGVFKKNTEVKENAEGNTDQAVAVYTLSFAKVTRAIG